MGLSLFSKFKHLAIGECPRYVSVQGGGQFRIEDRGPWKDAKVEQDLFAGNFQFAILANWKCLPIVDMTRCGERMKLTLTVN